MIKRSKNHEALNAGANEKPHLFLSENGTGLYCAGGPRGSIDSFRIFDLIEAVWRMDKIWADQLSGRIFRG